MIKGCPFGVTPGVPVPWHVLERRLSECQGLRVSGSIINDDKDVFMAPGKLQHRPYKVHLYVLEWHIDDGRGNQQGEWWVVGRGKLTLPAPLYKAYLSHHPGPLEAFSDSDQGVFCSKVATQRICVG